MDEVKRQYVEHQVDKIIIKFANASRFVYANMRCEIITDKIFFGVYGGGFSLFRHVFRAQAQNRLNERKIFKMRRRAPDLRLLVPRFQLTESEWETAFMIIVRMHDTLHQIIKWGIVDVRHFFLG